MSKTDEYNPLDYDNLTKNCFEELMRRGPFPLKFDEQFGGAGVYALFYLGDLDFYAPIKAPKADHPIYVGKAVPAGARKGAKSSGTSKALWKRLREHLDSISSAGNLEPNDFLCRYLAVTPLWITMAERFLVEHYQPVWNVAIDGFGLHNPGKRRETGQRSWWDVLHEGRSWAKKLEVGTRTADQAKEKVTNFLATHAKGQVAPPLDAKALAAALAEGSEEDDEQADDE